VSDVDDRMAAGVAMLGRTGAQTFRVGYSAEDDGDPVVWYAVAQWVGNRAEAAGALDPVTAVMRLCEQVIDGGMCAHCHRPTIFDPEGPLPPNPMDDALAAMGCVYAWDPELRTFRRSCEGEAP
jgi:hypothetical protein